MGWPPAFAWVSSSLRSGVARATCDDTTCRTYAEDQPKSASIIYLGLDVHKDSITLVLPADAPAPTRVDRLPNDLPKLKRYFARLVGEGTLRICYEASGAGFVLHRALRAWGYHCDVIAPR